MLGFYFYSFLSMTATVGVIYNAIQKQETFFNTVVFLTSQKINLLIFFNFLVVVLMNLGNFLVWIFFDKIRSIESKVILLFDSSTTVVHNGQESEESLSLPLASLDPEKYL